MTFSYSLPTAGVYAEPRDQIRFLIGDYDTDNQQIQDEELDALMIAEDEMYLQAALACDVIAAKYARRVDIAVGQDLGLTMSQRFAQYTQMAANFRQQAASTATRPQLCGASWQDKDQYSDNDDLVKNVFYRGMEQYRGSRESGGRR